MCNNTFVALILLFCVPVSHATTAEQGLQEAISAYNSENYLTARRLFKEIAHQGNPVAQRFLAQMYDKGQGGLQNYTKAVEWYKKAAKQNDSKAQYLLGVKYANGHGVPVDEKLAYTWFAIAFNNGYELAASPLKVFNQTLSMTVRQEALQLATKKLTELP
jgi:TPR repeat protein